MLWNKADEEAVEEEAELVLLSMFWDEPDWEGPGVAFGLAFISPADNLEETNSGWGVPVF